MDPILLETAFASFHLFIQPLFRPSASGVEKQGFRSRPNAVRGKLDLVQQTIHETGSGGDGALQFNRIVRRKDGSAGRFPLLFLLVWPLGDLQLAFSWG